MARLQFSGAKFKVNHIFLVRSGVIFWGEMCSLAGLKKMGIYDGPLIDNRFGGKLEVRKFWKTVTLRDERADKR